MGTLLTARQQHASPPPRFISPSSFFMELCPTLPQCWLQLELWLTPPWSSQWSTLPLKLAKRSPLTLFLLLLDITASPPLVTTAKGLLMPSPPSWLEPAGSSLPPLPSSTTLLPFLWPTLTHWPTLATLATLAFPWLT